MGQSAGGLGSEGRARRGEGDLLAERRARRVAESGEHALARRAEAAEATVRTLETHVASLQQRLREVEAAGGEGELRRLSQHEYAEQRLRVEVEERLLELERDSRAELERLRRRVRESEAETGMLAGRIDNLRRELAEAEQGAAAARTALQRAQGALKERVAELEGHAAGLQRELDAERAARAAAERMLEMMRQGQRRLEALAGELRGVVSRLRTAAEPPRRAGSARLSPAAQQAPAAGAGLSRRPQAPAQARGEPAREDGEMAQALAAAVERLRARAAAGEEPTGAPFRGPSHKHSMSLIGRWRMRRKQRRGR